MANFQIHLYEKLKLSKVTLSSPFFTFNIGDEYYILNKINLQKFIQAKNHRDLLNVLDEVDSGIPKALKKEGIDYNQVYTFFKSIDPKNLNKNFYKPSIPSNSK